MIHPEFNKPYTIWEGERVRVDWTPSLRAKSFEYLAEPNTVLLADSIHQKGLHSEYRTAGKGTPLVTYAKNPDKTPEEHHYPTTGLVLGITAVEEKRRGQVPLLKPIFYRQRLSFLGRSSSEAARRAIEAPLIQKCSANSLAFYRFGIAFYREIWLLGVDPSSNHVFSGQARRFLSLPADRP